MNIYILVCCGFSDISPKTIDKRKCKIETKKFLSKFLFKTDSVAKTLTEENNREIQTENNYETEWDCGGDIFSFILIIVSNRVVGYVGKQACGTKNYISSGLNWFKKLHYRFKTIQNIKFKTNKYRRNILKYSSPCCSQSTSYFVYTNNLLLHNQIDLQLSFGADHTFLSAFEEEQFVFCTVSPEGLVASNHTEIMFLHIIYLSNNQSLRAANFIFSSNCLCNSYKTKLIF